MHAEPAPPSSGPDRVVQALEAEITGLSPGAPLPSVRDLCARLGASPNTVQRAMARLARDGRIETVPGRGSFVRRSPEPARASDLSWQSLALGARPPRADDLDHLVGPVPPGEISLRGGYADESLQPVAGLQAAITRASRRPGVWGRQPVAGHPELRAWFALEAGPDSKGSDVLVVPGGQSALTVIFRALCPPGAPLLVESPTYVGALAVARGAGIVPVPVPTDADGVLPDALASAFRATGARVFYLQPNIANPSGAVLAPDRRSAVLAAAEAAGAFVIEDDYAHDLGFEPLPPPLVRLDPGRVIHVRSLTKAAAPSLRVAGVCARGPVAARLRSARAVDDLFVSGPLQEAALELVTSPGWPRHLARLRAAMSGRAEAAVAAVRASWPGARVSTPRGGYNLWVELPAGVDERQFVARGEAAGVHTSPGGMWFPAEPTAPFVRLSYAAADLDAIETGVRRLGALLAHLRSLGGP